MHHASIRPPVIPLTMWLNALRMGHISTTDAANACEAITECEHLQHAGNSVTWNVLIEIVTQQHQPCIAVLPLHGNPHGLPSAVLSEIDIARGAIAIGNDLIVYQDHTLTWNMVNHVHTVVQPDHSFSRQRFLEGIQRATHMLSSAELVGNRSTIDKQLDELAHTHLPPSSERRYIEFLNQAIRVRAVTQLALTSTTAVSSRSTDNQRVATLQEIDELARNLMAAIVSR